MPFRPKNSRFWHYDFQTRGRRFHGSCGTEDYEEAKAVEAEARVNAKAQASAKRVATFTLSEVLGTYCADIGDHQPSQRTTNSQAKMILSVLDPRVAMQDLTQAEIQRFVSRRRAVVSNATVNRQLQLLGRALRHMARTHGATMPSIDLVAAETKEPAERIRELTWAEQERLFDKLRTDLHPLVKLALMTGAREDTLCGLKWSDVDLDTQRLRFRLKGGDTMHFPINGELRAFLSALPRSAEAAHRAYVLTYENRRLKALPRHRIKAVAGGIFAEFRAALTAAEIEDFRFHDLRHTFATRMLRQTGNLKLVSRLLGHKSIETTMRYAHVLDDDLRQAIDGYSMSRHTIAAEQSKRTR